MIIDVKLDPTPILGEKKYIIEVERKRKHKFPRLKVHKNGLLLMLPDTTSDDDVARLKNVSLQIFLAALEKGIPGTMFGRFGPYDGIVMTYKGKAFSRSFDQAAFERDHPIANPAEVSMVVRPDLRAVVDMARQELNLEPGVTLQ
jgi:hypothetical protein